MMKVRKQAMGLLLAIVLFVSLLNPVASAGSLEPPATSFGQVVDVRRAELGPGALYTWYDMQTARGTQKAHFVEFDPLHPDLALIAGTKSGYVRGMEGVSEMAAYADGPGNRVIAGINGDFFEISGNATGVPNGLFIGGGRILNSASSPYAFGLKADGTSVYGTPVLTKTITIDGATTDITHINRFRNDNQLVLYTVDYYASTMTSNAGDEVILNIVEGDVVPGSTLQLQVAEVKLNQGNSPLVQGQIVLSASGTARSVLADLQPGDEVTATFAISPEWADVQVAIGGTGPLIKDGVVQIGVGPAGIHPRTAIGTKADGSIVLFEIDGRQPGLSEGVETEELAAILADLGVVQAMNLDGGGSSTLVARMPGESGVKVMNSPSDGGERKTGNGLLLVNTAPELAVADRLAVQPNAERILAGSSFPFRAAGIDANGHPAAYSGAPQWQVDAGLGVVSGDGIFTAGPEAGIGLITSQADGIYGTAEIEVVDQLTALAFPDESKTYDAGSIDVLTVIPLRSGQIIQAHNSSFEWRVEGDIGEVDQNGVFTATSEDGESGKIIASFGDIEASMDVSVGISPVLLETFESGLSAYQASGAAYNSVQISEENNPDFVRFGDTSLKLEYDFIGQTGTSGAYLQANTVADYIEVPGYPQKISMWVYGDGKNHWLRMQMRDGNNAAFPLDLTDQAIGVDWVGWKYVEVEVPAGKAGPLKIDMPVRYMETSNNKKDAGVIYVDDIRALYGTVNEDITPPVIKDIYPEENTTVRVATPTISATGEDDSYDPALHPATTLIDPAKIRVYLDDQLVQHGLYPPTGRITYTPTEPLAEGRHKAKIAVRDMDGNQTIKEWYFNVNLGSPQFQYETPDEVYAGQTYTLQIKAESAGKLKGGHAEYEFDPAIAYLFEVQRGPKLDEAQMDYSIDEENGLVRVDFNGLDSSSLTDSDLLAEIRYTVRSDVIGPLGLEQANSGETTKEHIISFKSGSIAQTEGDGAAKEFFGPPLASTVRNHLQLTWNHYDTALGYPAAFSIRQDGAGVEGAELLIDGVAVADASSDANGQLSTAAATAEEGTYLIQAVKDGRYSPIMTFTVAPLVHTGQPININVSLGESPVNTRHFTWHTHPHTEATVVEWAEQDGFAGFDGDNVTSTSGFSYIYNSNNDGTFRVHKAEVTGLAPDTEYVYRVGDGAGHVSAEGSFRTAAEQGDDLKLLFLGDSQASSQDGFDLWGQSLAAAVNEMPDAELIVHAGDMVDHGHQQEQWNMWFDAAQDIFLRYTLQTVVGNHEVTGTNGYGDYLAHFHNPQNGLENALGTVYSFDIKDTHFVMLNTEMSVEALQEQAEWLEQDLKSTDKKWKIAVFHQGPYGSIYANTNVQAHWVPIFERYGVDLVLNGHDHIYLRTYPMKDGQKTTEAEGTRYVIGGSTGPKFYELTERPWQEFVYDENDNIYTAVEIAGDTLTITAKTVDGRLVDRFDIVKPLPVSIATDREHATIAVGQSLALQAEVLPARAEQKVVWSVVRESSSEIVELTPTGTLKGLKAGTATIRATSADEDIYADVSITVQAGSVPPVNPPVTPPSDSGRLVVTADQLLSGAEGDQVVIEAKERLTELVLPANAAKLIGEATLVVKAGNVAAAFSPQLLNELTSGLSEDQLTASNFTLLIDELDRETAESLLDAASRQTAAELTLAGAFLEMKLTVTDAAGQQRQIDAFSHPLILSLPLEERTDARLTGIYYIADDGSVSYVGGSLQDGWLTAGLTHFSKYAPLEFRKRFADVPQSHWASDVIAELAAKQVVQGVSLTRYAPEQHVTRAEFAALLVRAIGLEGAAESAFSDVPSHAWFAKEVALARQAGIVNGKTETVFAPDDMVTRQEMAAMIARAYEHASGKLLQAAGTLPFSDTDLVPQWAQRSIAAAFELKLMQGYPSRTFKPLSFGTRAESAKLLHNFWTLVRPSDN